VSAERDDQGRLVGFALTLRATPHRYTTAGGRTFYAWCATDALMLPVILGEPAVVESTCAQTGEPIRIEVTPEGVERVDPPEAVMSAVRPGGRFADVRVDVPVRALLQLSRDGGRVDRSAPGRLRALGGEGVRAGP
jgi:alkylmercury lyase